MSAVPFSSFQGALQVNMTGNSQIIPSGGVNPISGQAQIGPYNIAFGLGTGISLGNEMVGQIRTLAASATETLLLSSALQDILGQSSITLARIRAIMIVLLSSTVGQTGYDSVNGTACSSISLGSAASHPWITGPFGATDNYKIGGGELWLHVCNSSTGMTVSSAGSEQLKIINNDSTYAAHYIFALIGAAS